MNDILQILYRYGEPTLIQHAIDCVVDILKKYCKNEQDASIILRKLFREEDNGSKVIQEKILQPITDYALFILQKIKDKHPERLFED
jgi:hypothetical protein